MPRRRRLRYPPASGLSPLLLDLLARVEAGSESDQAICDRAGVANTLLSCWRRGRNAPTLGAFEAMVQALGGKINVEWEE